MAELVIDRDSLTVALSPLERLGALRRANLTFDVTNIVTIDRVRHGRSHVSGLRFPGTHIPWKALLGTFVKQETRTFAAAYNNDPAYVITLKDEDFARLIVSGPENEALENLGLSPNPSEDA